MAGSQRCVLDRGLRSGVPSQAAAHWYLRTGSDQKAELRPMLIVAIRPAHAEPSSTAPFWAVLVGVRYLGDEAKTLARPVLFR